MEEKVMEWAEFWEIQVSNFYDGKTLFSFEIESKSITRPRIKTLEELTGKEISSIDFYTQNLTIWLEK